MNHKGRDVKIEARETAIPSTYTNLAKYNVNALVPNLDDAATVKSRTGVWGGDNGYNRAPEDTAWDPVFDREAKPVPIGGAIVVGHKGDSCSVYVHPITFAERYVPHAAMRDAMLEGRTEFGAIRDEANALTDGECAVLYAHWGYKSGDSRKRVVARYADALETCIARALISRNAKGSCAITTAGKALSDTWRKRGEDLAYRL